MREPSLLAYLKNGCKCRLKTKNRPLDSPALDKSVCAWKSGFCCAFSYSIRKSVRKYNRFIKVHILPACQIIHFAYNVWAMGEMLSRNINLVPRSLVLGTYCTNTKHNVSSRHVSLE